MLLVEDDDSFARAVIAPSLPPSWPVYFAYNVQQAVRLIQDLPRIDAALIDYGLPGGNGIDVLDAFRRRYPDAPAALLTAWLQADLARLCCERNATYLVKEDTASVVKVFASKLRVVERPADRLAELAVQRGLSAREVQILALAITGHERAAIAAHLALSENTVKSYVRSILEKTFARSLRALARRLAP